MVIKKEILIFAVIFVLGFALRLGFMPREYVACDSFEVMTASKTLADTGRYEIPEVGFPDLKIHYTHAGWPVGFALILSTLFKIFGYSDGVAVMFTIFMSSLVIILTAIIAGLFWDRRTAYIAGLFVAINPLLVAFNGRIFTNNPELFFLMLSFALLFISVIRRSDHLKFVDLKSVIATRWRLVTLLASFLSYGFLLTVRDTAAMFCLVYVYVFIKCGLFSAFRNKNSTCLMVKLLLGALVVFFVGYLPSLYYNYQNFGTILTSTHQQWGGRLDLKYFFMGGGNQVSLPGSIIMIATFMVYCFPLFILFFIDKYTDKDKFFSAIVFLLFLPILLINGSYFTASSGASPRYMLPLMPFLSILLARGLLNLSPKLSYAFRSIIVILIFCWLMFLAYPPKFLFKISPKFAYATQYSPVYQVYPYKNYPLHSNALAKWVKENTSENAIIITPSRAYHFFYYGNRDVVFLTKLDGSQISTYLMDRPVFYVEDHTAVYNPESWNTIKALSENAKFRLMQAGEVEVFSPVVGDASMKIYKLLK